MYNDTLHTSDIDIANALNTFFSSIGRDISNSFSSTYNGTSTMSSLPNSFFLRHTTPMEVNLIINNMKNKSCPITTYPVRALKVVADLISPVISVNINNSIDNGIFPDSLKVARVVPLHKGGIESHINNYRPVSILPLISKIFERAVFNRLSSFLSKYNLISKNQYGFRTGKSTTTAITDLLNYVYSELDKGNVVVSIFLDFRKAFDCINHDILLTKLEKFGVRGSPLDWFKSYLSNRAQCVSIASVTSTYLPVTHGVPQGSILGPLLFLIFINDFPNSNDFFKFNLFADDSTLSCSFENTDSNLMLNTINNALLKVDEWLMENKISVNHEKSNFIIFSYRKKVALPALKLGSSFINETESTKFLGLILDSHLDFKDHIHFISSKVSKTIGLISKLNEFFPENQLKSLYHTMFLPRISYGIEAWFGASKTASDRIVVLQKRAIRAIYKLPYNAHTNAYFKSAGILKVNDIYRYQIGIIFFNSVRDGSCFLNSRDHDHNTRYRDNLIVPRMSRSKSQACWLYQGGILWNSLPETLRQSKSIKTYKCSLKEWFVSTY